MTFMSALSPLAIAALLALLPMHEAVARSGKTGSPALSKAPTASYGEGRVVRDHRVSPRPWAPPRHRHHHGNRRR